MHLKKIYHFIFIGLSLTSIWVIYTHKYRAEIDSQQQIIEKSSSNDTYQQKVKTTETHHQEKDTINNKLAAVAKQLENINNRITALEKNLNTAISDSMTPTEEMNDLNMTEEPMLPKNYVHAFNQFIYAQDLDDDWSDYAHADIQVALSELRSDVPELAIIESVCHSTVCKVNYQLPSEDNIYRKIEKISSSLDWGSTTYSEYEINEAGQAIVTGFYMRKGHDFPPEILASREHN